MTINRVDLMQMAGPTGGGVCRAGYAQPRQHAWGCDNTSQDIRYAGCITLQPLPLYRHCI